MAAPSSSASTDYYKDDDSAFIEALHDLPIGSQPNSRSQTSEQPPPVAQPTPGTHANHVLPLPVEGLVEDDEMEMPPPAQPCLKRRRMSDASDEDDIGSSHHQVLTSVDEGKNTQYLSNDTYGPSRFGNFGQYMSRKRAKLQIQNAELDDCDERSLRKGIFHGLQINGWTQPSVQDLRELIIRHGGVFHAYLDRKGLVTHIITCALTPAKMREFQHMKVVRPEWLVESAKVGTLLPWQDYRFKAGPRLDESQGKKAAQKSLFDNFVSPLRPEPSNETPHALDGIPGFSSLPSSPSDIHSLASTPSANATSPIRSQGSCKPAPRLVTDLAASSPEMPPPRQPPRPTTPQTPASSAPVRLELQASHRSIISGPSPILLPVSSPVSPAQLPLQPSESPQQLLQASSDPHQLPQEFSPPDLQPSNRMDPPFANTVLPASPTSPTPLRSERPKYAEHESNPNAQRVMANPEWRKAHTSVAPDFIEGYYRNSRLHHLSSWKVELRGLVAEAMERAEQGQNGGDSDEGEGGVRGDREDDEDGNPVAKVVRENMSGVTRLPKNGSAGVSMKDAHLVLRSPKSKSKGKERAISDSTGDNQDRVIMHCDFDSFFVSAGLVERPHLKGKPVVVCHSQGAQGGGTSTSEIASASYEARKFGIKGGMSLQQARKLCASVVTIPYEFQTYKKYSLLFYTILMAHADDLQAVSVDEALIDVTSSVKRIQSYISQAELDEGVSGDPAKDLAEAIRTQVRKATSCEVSIGISYNIMLSRLASRKAKPAGSYHILPSDVAQIITPLDIDDLHGFGWSARQKAEERLGTTNLGELRGKSRSVLCDALGKAMGEMLFKAIRGIDERKLESDKVRKSVSCDINYGIRFENSQQAEAFIYQLAEEVAKRMNDIEMKGRSLTLKIMKRDPSAPVEAPKFMGHGKCETFSKQIQIIAPGGRATSDGKVIGDHAWKLLKSFNFDPKELRGIAIQIQKLEKTGAAPEVEQGQAVLPFKRLEKQKDKVAETSVVKPAEPKRLSSMPPPPLPQARVQGSPEDEDIVELVGPSRQPVKPPPPPDLPNFSQLDMSVLEALPEDIRRELENEYKKRADPNPQPEAGPSKPKPANDLSAFLVAPAPKFKISVKGTKAPNVARITKQLAPRNKPTIPSAKSTTLFKKRENAIPTTSEATPVAETIAAPDLDSIPVTSSGGVKTTDEELRKLGIDLEVFVQLPQEVQLEQLRGARLMEANKGKGEAFGGPRKTLKPVRPPKFIDPDYTPYVPPPPPKANFGPPPPSLKRPGVQKGGDLVRFTDTEEVMEVIGQWVERFADWPPHVKDVQFFAGYLVKCVDPDVSPGSGLERGISVMKWWLVLLRRKYGEWESKGEEERDLWDSPLPKNRNGYTSEDIGRAWWSAFRDVKSQMDVAARKRFGGKISLK